MPTIRSKRFIITISLFFILVCLAIPLGFLLEKSVMKAEDLVRRIQKLEQSMALVGDHLGDALASYQSQIRQSDLVPPKGSAEMLKGSWNLFGGQGANGSWVKDKFKRARAIEQFNDAIYIGLDGGREGRAEVWQFSKGAWSQVAGQGTNSSWNDSSEVVSLKSFKGKLYAGLVSVQSGASLWRFDGRVWELIGGKNNGSWSRKDFQTVGALEIYEENLIVAVSSPESPEKNLPPAVYSFDGVNWRLIQGSLDWEEDYQGIYELFTHSDNSLYAGMIGDAGHGDVMRYSEGNWEKVGGDGINNSWINPSMDWILRFADYQGQLIALANRTPPTNGRFSTIWAFDGNNWAPLARDCGSSRLKKLNNINAVEVISDNLLIGAGGAPAGQASIWRLDNDGCWELFAGFGSNGSWGKRDGKGYLTYRSAREYVYRMVTIDDDLYVGFGSSPGSAQVWRLQRN